MSRYMGIRGSMKVVPIIDKLKERVIVLAGRYDHVMRGEEHVSNQRVYR